MRRTLLALAVFAGALFLMFPTDAIVRALLGRITPSDGPAVVFGHASLRPWGIWLDDVAVRQPDGSAIMTADRLTLRASLRSFVAPRTATGELQVHGGMWRLGNRTSALEALHADPGLVVWRFDSGNLVLDRVDLRGPEMEMSGQATLRLASALGASTLELAMAIVPGSAASPRIHDLLASLPPAEGKPGARLLTFTGTVGALRLLY